MKNGIIRGLCYFCLFGVIALGLMTIIGTGGGGGDSSGTASSGISYSGLTNPATIDANNAEDLLVGAYEGGQTGAAIGQLSVAQTEPRASIRYPRILKVSQVLEDSLRQVDLTARSGEIRISSSKSKTGTIPGACGGSASYTVSVNDQTGDFSGSLSFSSYCEDGVTISGAVDFSGKVDLVTEELVKFSLTFSALSGTSGSDSFTLNGTISTDLTVSPYILAISMLLRDNSTGKVYWVKDYTMTVTEGADYGEVEISGAYYDPDYGYVTFSTTVPFRIYDYDDYPTDGVLVVTGDIGIAGGSTMARLTVLSSATYQIEADTDGDGTYDWDSGILYW
jgi:hypothetical protein